MKANNNNNNYSTTRGPIYNVMVYLATAPIIQPHMVEIFCSEDQCQWGQFVDIDPAALVCPSNVSSVPSTDPINQKKTSIWKKPGCYTIKETSEEIPECDEEWEEWAQIHPPRSTLCSHVEFIGKFALSILQSVIFIDYLIPIMSTVEPRPQ
jgi:hypothetical protein